jgi:hypothetical protein
MITRRSILRGLIAAPSVVAFSSLMPIRGIIMSIDGALGGSMTPEEVARFYARMQAYEQALRENELITGLQNDGVWDKLESLWVFNQYPIDACRIK